MDIPLGGLGQEDIAGGVILPDGSHGHMYIFYEPPTWTNPVACSSGQKPPEWLMPIFMVNIMMQREPVLNFPLQVLAKREELVLKSECRIVDYTKDGKGKEVADPNWLQQLQQAEQNVQAGLITSKELVGKASKEVEQKLFGDRLSKRPEEQPVSTENANNSASSENEDENMNQETQNNVNTEQEENE